MTPALYEVTTIHINADEYSFRTNGSRKIFPGYTAVYKEENDEDNTDEDVNLPPLKGRAVNYIKRVEACNISLNLLHVIPKHH